MAENLKPLSADQEKVIDATIDEGVAKAVAAGKVPNADMAKAMAHTMITGTNTAHMVVDDAPHDAGIKRLMERYKAAHPDDAPASSVTTEHTKPHQVRPMDTPSDSASAPARSYAK